jgi:hypothetical protein
MFEALVLIFTMAMFCSGVVLIIAAVVYFGDI